MLDLGRGNGFLFGFLVFITSMLGSIFILIPFIPFAYLAPKHFRWIADRCVGYWLTFPASLIEFVFGVKFQITGDLIDHKAPAIILMNHRTRLDWLFLWNALYKMDPWLLTSEKISLKAGLKKIPGAGWAMGCASFIFLDRNFEKDCENIKNLIKYYKDSGQNYQILLFPEGTDRDTRSIELSKAFAESKDLPMYDYCLHPRVTGFQYILDLMRKENYIKYIYDVTVGYPENIVQSEKILLKEGKFPRSVHFDFHKIPVDEVPVDKNGCEFWLNSLWRLKEARLRKFYEKDGKFEPSGSRYAWPVPTTGFGYWLAFTWWVVCSILWIYFTYQYLFVKIYVFLGSAFYIYALKYDNGVEFLMIKWFYLRFPHLRKES